VFKLITVQRVKPKVLGLTAQVLLHNKLPPQKTVLTPAENKRQLDTSYHQTAEDKSFHAECTRNQEQVLIGESSPVEISKSGIVINWRDLETTHEEMDKIIVQKVMICAQSSEQPE
jgi:hypothetical protein